MNPWIIDVGSVRLTVYRILLLAALLPCLWLWATGKGGRIRMPEVFLVLFCGWAALCLILGGGAAALQSAGILIVETFIPFLIARCAIRSADDFYSMVKILFWAVVFLFPLALHETLTGSKLLLETFGTVFRTVEVTMMTPRLGLWRVQGPFDHSILFGVCCGCIIALVHLVLGENQSRPRRWLQTGLVVMTAFLSLSSGAMTAMAAQALLLLWYWLLRGYKARWKILIGLVALLYVFIAFGSNQSVPAFYISRFSLDQQSAGFRLLIWDYGSASAMDHPWFGVGLGEWSRPKWMPASIDMFWLVNAVRYGLPGGFLMLAAFFAAFLGIGFKRGVRGQAATIRTAWMIVMIGFFMVGWTVHFWNSTYVLFLFLMGSGMWLLDASENDVEAGENRISGRRSTMKTRSRISAPEVPGGVVPKWRQQW